MNPWAKFVKFNFEFNFYHKKSKPNEKMGQSRSQRFDRLSYCERKYSSKLYQYMATVFNMKSLYRGTLIQDSN